MLSESRLLVGSSKRYTCTLENKAKISFSFCFIPLDKSLNHLSHWEQTLENKNVKNLIWVFAKAILWLVKPLIYPERLCEHFHLYSPTDIAEFGQVQIDLIWF